LKGWFNMTEMMALRLYLSHSARAKPTRFWHHLSAPVLSHHLLSAARRSGIEQVLLHSVHAGYLPGNNMSHRHLENTSAHHPICIELIEHEERLRKFMHDHAVELQHVRAVMFRCEVVI
jgi:PII-like signaling protein